MRSPLRVPATLADRFAERGVYLPGDGNSGRRAWREFGWTAAGWLLAVLLFVVVLAATR